MALPLVALILLVSNWAPQGHSTPHKMSPRGARLDLTKMPKAGKWTVHSKQIIQIADARGAILDKGEIDGESEVVETLLGANAFSVSQTVRKVWLVAGGAPISSAVQRESGLIGKNVLLRFDRRRNLFGGTPQQNIPQFSMNFPTHPVSPRSVWNGSAKVGIKTYPAKVAFVAIDRFHRVKCAKLTCSTAYKVSARNGVVTCKLAITQWIALDTRFPLQQDAVMDYDYGVQTAHVLLSSSFTSG